MKKDESTNQAFYVAQIGWWYVEAKRRQFLRILFCLLEFRETESSFQSSPAAVEAKQMTKIPYSLSLHSEPLDGCVDVDTLLESLTAHRQSSFVAA